VGRPPGINPFNPPPDVLPDGFCVVPGVVEEIKPSINPRVEPWSISTIVSVVVSIGAVNAASIKIKNMKIFKDIVATGF
jgi:hypothetical protein